MANEDPFETFELGDAVMTPNGVGVITGRIDRNGEIGLVVSISTIFTPEQVAPFGLQMRHACAAAVDQVNNLNFERAMESAYPLQGSEAL